MVRFITVFTSALSLLSFTRAATINTRECTYDCPPDNVYGKPLLERVDLDTIFVCTYDGGKLGSGGVATPVSDCNYDIVSHIPLTLPALTYTAPQKTGQLFLIGFGSCYPQATQKC